MSSLFAITFSLLVAFVFSEIFYRLNFSRVIGQMFGGLILAIPFIKSNIFQGNANLLIENLASLGVVFLMLLTGIEIDIEKMKKNSRDSILIATFSAIIPFLLGLSLGIFMKLELITSFILGACLAVTAEGTTVSILLELKKLKTKIGSIILEAGLIDDIFEIIFLTAVVILAKDGSLTENIYILPLKIFVFFIIVSLAYKIIPKIVQNLEKDKSDIALFNLTIIIGLLFAIFAELAGVSSILGAFLAGIILQKSFGIKKDEMHDEKNLKMITFGFIIPFFFIYIGINFDYATIINNPQLSLIVLSIAIAGKILGALLVKPFSKLSFKQLHLIGWGMNSRGVMELVIAEIARSNNLISNELFSAIVFMAISTTLIFPFVIRLMVKLNPKIMN